MRAAATNIFCIFNVLCALTYAGFNTPARAGGGLAFRAPATARWRRSAERAWLFREKAERLINEGVGVLEDAAMARIREDAELRVGKGVEQRD